MNIVKWFWHRCRYDIAPFRIPSMSKFRIEYMSGYRRDDVGHLFTIPMKSGRIAVFKYIGYDSLPSVDWHWINLKFWGYDE